MFLKKKIKLLENYQKEEQVKLRVFNWTPFQYFQQINEKMDL